MSGLNILVVGASVAGPMAAYWLAKAGAQVTVIERCPELRKGGQSIDIRTSAVTIMRKMPGMEEAVRAKSTKEEGIAFIDTNGKAFASWTTSGNAEQQSFTSEFEILRGDLARVLYDLTKDDPRVKYIFGEQILSMRQSTAEGGGPIEVEFTNGLPTAKYDLLVACDGATSRTRAMAFECSVWDHTKSINSWGALFTVKEDLLEGKNLGIVYNSTPGRVITVRPDPSRISHVCIIDVASKRDKARADEFREVLKKGEAATKQFVADKYRGIGWKADSILDTMMDPATDFYAWDFMQVKFSHFTRGRVALVGDAGYTPGPFTGAGTTLAITGAYVLAGEIAKHKGDLAAGLKAYEDRMRPLVDRFQKMIIGFPQVMAPQSAWTLKIRNALLWFVAKSRALDLLSRLGGGSTFGQDDYGIPDYQFEVSTSDA